MCLTISSREKPGYQFVYKVVYKRMNRSYQYYLCSPYFYFKHIIGEWSVAPGDVHINESRQEIFSGCIHAYTSLNDAMFNYGQFMRYTYKKEFAILKCEVNDDDFVASGVDGDVAYTKILPLEIVWPPKASPQEGINPVHAEAEKSIKRVAA